MMSRLGGSRFTEKTVICWRKPRPWSGSLKRKDRSISVAWDRRAAWPRRPRVRRYPPSANLISPALSLLVSSARTNRRRNCLPGLLAPATARHEVNHVVIPFVTRVLEQLAVGLVPRNHRRPGF